MEVIKTEAPKHSPELLSAVEHTLKSHSLRLKPDQDLGTVVDALSARGIKLTAEHGYLAASQTTAGLEQAMHVNSIIEGLANQEAARFYPRNVDNIESRDAMDAKGKRDYITKHGLAAFEKLPQSQPTITTVVLDRTRLTAKEYLSLPRAQRAELAGTWGSAAVGAILARRK